MSSIKCPQCGLVNWATAEACKRCKLPFAAPPAQESPAPPPHDAAPPADADQTHDEAPGGSATPPGVTVPRAFAPHAAPPYETPPGVTPHEAPGGAASYEAASHAAATHGAAEHETAHDATNSVPPPGGASPPPFHTPPPHYSHTPPAGHFREWRSPYDMSGADDDGSRLDISFEVAPFVDTAMVIRDTFAMTSAQFGLILRVVLTAIVPQVLLILAFGAGHADGPAGLPAGMLSFGAPPVARAGGGAATAELAGLFSFFLLLLVGYQFVRLAVMPSALIYGLVTTLNTGTSPGVFECFRWGLRRSFSAGFAMLLTGVLTFFGLLLLVVPGVFLALSFSMVIPIVAIEGRGAVEAMGRSWELSRGRRPTIFFSTVAWTVLAVIVTLVTTFFLGLVAAVLRSSVIGALATTFIVELVGATGVVLSLVVYLGIARYGAGAPARAASARKTIIVLVAACCVVLAGFVAIVAAIAVPNFRASQRAANEAAAIRGLRKVVAAQETFSTLEDRYGSLEELAERKLIDDELARGEAHGYRFEVSVVGGSYEATATPVAYGRTGARSFYASADGVLRVADRRGRKARADDLPLNEYRPPKVQRRTDSPVIDPGAPAW